MTNTIGAIGVESRAWLGNPAPAEAAVHELIRERWSPRAFSARPVGPESLHALLEAARWAPSCMNEQPWAFVIAGKRDDPEGHARIGSTLVPDNAAWALRAPLLMIAAARTSFARNGTANRWALYDTGQAVAALTFQATALGLAVHQMGGFDTLQARSLLNIPEGYEPVAALAVGYPGDASELSAELRAREAAPRRRRPIGEWAYSGQWGHPWTT